MAVEAVAIDESSGLVARACGFAAAAHRRQVRKYTGEPYLLHLMAVAHLVRDAVADDETVAAAYLHDTVEDTATTLEDIRAQFGTRVAKLVAEVTAVSRPEDGNRAARKELDCLHLANASPAGKTIKLADLIDNTRSIAQHDPKFARVYMVEKRRLLSVLREGDATLYAIAEAQLADWDAGNTG